MKTTALVEPVVCSRQEMKPVEVDLFALFQPALWIELLRVVVVVRVKVLLLAAKCNLRASGDA